MVASAVELHESSFGRIVLHNKAVKVISLTQADTVAIITIQTKRVG